MRRIAVDSASPDEGALKEVAAIVAAGGVVAIPTDTLYGLAVDPFSPAAIARVFAVKGRPSDRALPLVGCDVEQLTRAVGDLPPLGRQIADRYWPGPLTLVVTRPATLPDDLTGGIGSVAIRVPAHPVTRALCRVCGIPLTATSANMSGEPPSANPDDISRTLGTRIDVLLDAGRTPGGQPSTIVDVTASEPRLIRAGAIPWTSIEQCLNAV